MSVNFTDSGAFPDVGDAVKAATGAGAFVDFVVEAASAVADNSIILINAMDIFCFVLIVSPAL
ncbi:hypothetical protein [Methanosarcina sp.]|uniref:hypothetical protein n=1 Tax=Methanosarcina sp. TaxID=2213 RepID=UPI0029880319|nr:hypothetical protein [Methanosarcina sp.]MDW5555099.1 hypothetical protein [Methanosarcina sp.]